MNLVHSHELVNTDYEGLQLCAPYGRLLGEIEAKASVLYHGPAGSGKSYLVTGIARALAEHGTVLYCSSEEGPGMTTSHRFKALNAWHPNLVISDFTTIEALQEAIEQLEADFVILDSISYINPQSKEGIAFLKWCDGRGVGLHFVAHAKKEGKSYKGDSRFGHDCYCIFRVVDGHAYPEKHRYAGTADPEGIDVPFTSEQSGYRDNPDMSKECARPQTDRCKAMFARLEGGEQAEKKKKKPEAKKDQKAAAAKQPAKKQPAAAAASVGRNLQAAREKMSRLESMMQKILDD